MNTKYKLMDLKIFIHGNIDHPAIYKDQNGRLVAGKIYDEIYKVTHPKIKRKK